MTFALAPNGNTAHHPDLSWLRRWTRLCLATRRSVSQANTHHRNLCHVGRHIELAALLTSFVAFAIAIATKFISVTSVRGQVITPFGADLAIPAQCGRIIGRVVSGLLLGVLPSRTVSGLVARVFNWRAMYWITSGLLIVTEIVVYQVLPNEFARDRVSSQSLVAGSFALLVTQHQ